MSLEYQALSGNLVVKPEEPRPVVDHSKINIQIAAIQDYLKKDRERKNAASK